jgi:hypothetical protein
MHRLPEAWLAPPQVRELRELRRLPRQAGGAVGRPQGAGPCRARQARRAGADERPVRGRGHPAGGPIAAGARLRLADRLAAQPHHRLRPTDRDAGAGDLHGPGRRRRLPGHPDHPRVGPVLAAVFVAEIGDVHRFAGAPPLCSWAGLTPATASPTPPCAVAPSPSRAPGWSAGPRSRRCSGCLAQASRPPTSTASPRQGGIGIGRVAAARKLPTLV